MLKTIRQLCFASTFVLFCQPVWAADLNIAFLNRQAAILSTDRAKKFDEKLRDELKIEFNSVQGLRDEISDLRDRLRKEEDILSDEQRQKLEDDIRARGVRFEAQARALQQVQQQRLEVFLEDIAPSLAEVLTDLIAVEGYDAILSLDPRTQSVLYVNPIRDITRKVTEKLNEKI